MEHTLPVTPPFRLDFTVSALRRTSINPVDVYTADGHYLRALAGTRGPIVLDVTQPRADALGVRVHGGDPAMALATVRRMLGVDRDLAAFRRRARAFPWLAALARRSRGMKPPRYSGLFEAIVHAIVFQQVSLHAASAIIRRLILALAPQIDHDGVPLRVFPAAEALLAADVGVLRGAGLSAAKVRALREVGAAVASGAIDEATLECCSSEKAAARLRTLRGVGPWTAAVILLRGLGRLDVFPGRDSGVQAGLAAVAGAAVSPEPIVEALGPTRGMLYFQLLFARLEASGELARPTRHDVYTDATLR